MSWSATLVNSDATTVRTTVGNTSFGTVTFPGTEYLSRQKSYTLTVTCVVKGDVLNCAAPSTFNAPNPTGIKVNVSGNTTYDYYLASNFDQIWLQPSAEIGITGVNIEVPFFNKLLKKIGVDDALRQKGVKEGDSVILVDWEFQWYD